MAPVRSSFALGRAPQTLPKLELMQSVEIDPMSVATLLTEAVSVAPAEVRFEVVVVMLANTSMEVP